MTVRTMREIFGRPWSFKGPANLRLGKRFGGSEHEIRPSVTSLLSLQYPRHPSNLTPKCFLTGTSHHDPGGMGTSYIRQSSPTWSPGPPVWLLVKFAQTLSIPPCPTSLTCHCLCSPSSNDMAQRMTPTWDSQRKSPH